MPKIWSQPVSPLHPLALSALAAAAPLVLLLVLMGALRKSAYASAAWALAAALLVAELVWRMPVDLAAVSVGFGVVYALWPIMWIVLAALWLYNLAVETGSFDLLRDWMAQNASGHLGVQAILVAFCFGALLEGTAGFGAPVAVAAFLLVALGFKARKAVTVSLIANTAPVAFGALGIPIVALAAVTGLNQSKLSAMVGRQLPFISLILPAYLLWVVAGRKGLKQAWPAAVVGGGAFALTQFVVSNAWGPYAPDILASIISIAAVAGLLQFWKPAASEELEGRRKQSRRESVQAWLPWGVLAVVMIVWSVLGLFEKGALKIHVPYLHDAIQITLYHKLYAAIYSFQPLAAGTAGLAATLVTAILLKAGPGVVMKSGMKTVRQLALPGLTVCLIVALAYLYNYSGMTYTLGAALASLGSVFPFASGFLGWIACFMTGSDTASNLLFGNLQVAVAHRIGVSPLLLAATNSSGAVMGKMISPQNIAIGVTTVGLVGKEGEVLRTTFWHSILLAALLSALALAQAHGLSWMVP
ncbi:MAG: L-lactate permease [Terriglobia bacterium]